MVASNLEAEPSEVRAVVSLRVFLILILISLTSFSLTRPAIVPLALPLIFAFPPPIASILLPVPALPRVFPILIFLFSLFPSLIRLFLFLFLVLLLLQLRFVVAPTILTLTFTFPPALLPLPSAAVPPKTWRPRLTANCQRSCHGPFGETANMSASRGDYGSEYASRGDYGFFLRLQ